MPQERPDLPEARDFHERYLAAGGSGSGAGGELIARDAAILADVQDLDEALQAARRAEQRD